MTIPPALEATLAAIVPVMEAHALRPWWIVASAAVLLHGGDPGDVRDLDLLIDLADGPEVFAALGLPISTGEGDALFRSTLFGTWHGAPLPVELFAGFEIRESGAWVPVVPESHCILERNGLRLPVPGREELKAMLYRFGRPKDLVRAATL